VEGNSAIRFSIIIPTYNRGARIKYALDSLLNQTYKNFEVLICDDGSTDNTKEIVETFSGKLDLQYFWNENSGGPARPRNIGIRASKGDWVCFLDSDDWWYPEKLSVCMEFCNDANVIYHDMDIYSSSGKGWLKLRGRYLKGNTFESLLLDRNAICNSSAMLRRSLIDQAGFISESQHLFAVEDYDYWLRISKITDRFKYIPKSLGGYWVGSQNISISEKQISRTIAVFDAHVQDLRPEMRSEARNRLQYRLARMWQQFGDKKNTIACFSDSIHCRSKIYVLKTLFFGAFLIFAPRIVWKKI
jgi:glycosyltransferase involved in cell wall biosynthesis